MANIISAYGQHRYENRSNRPRTIVVTRMTGTTEFSAAVFRDGGGALGSHNSNNGVLRITIPGWCHLVISSAAEIEIDISRY